MGLKWRRGRGSMYALKASLEEGYVGSFLES